MYQHSSEQLPDVLYKKSDTTLDRHRDTEDVLFARLDSVPSPPRLLTGWFQLSLTSSTTPCRLELYPRCCRHPRKPTSVSITSNLFPLSLFCPNYLKTVVLVQLLNHFSRVNISLSKTIVVWFVVSSFVVVPAQYKAFCTFSYYL